MTHDKWMISVTLPANVHAGDAIHVQAPDGRLNEIVVPDGFGPGSTFTVEFADTPPPAPSSSAGNSYVPTTTPYVPPVATATQAEVPPPAQNPSYGNNNSADDGFASGFNNPNFVPTSTAPPTASATTSFCGIDNTPHIS